ncbi:hypothetical protein SAMN05660733_00691 [Lentzea albidocapillata]|uniref:Uncharacterized protein n=1 Tax=Lentzea albidocapillata TaxID=40571 RepID=A0A1W2AHZ6_9PSEU|nr:hypothetical protein SAMN05660733_00691 [Lentzea albidocapillata]
MPTRPRQHLNRESSSPSLTAPPTTSDLALPTTLRADTMKNNRLFAAASRRAGPMPATRAQKPSSMWNSGSRLFQFVPFDRRFNCSAAAPSSSRWIESRGRSRPLRTACLSTLPVRLAAPKREGAAVEGLDQPGICKVGVVRMCAVSRVLLGTIDDQQSRRACTLLVGHFPQGEVSREADQYEAAAARRRIGKSAYVRHELVVQHRVAQFRVPNVRRHFAEALGEPAQHGSGLWTCCSQAPLRTKS